MYRHFNASACTAQGMLGSLKSTWTALMSLFHLFCPYVCLYAYSCEVKSFNMEFFTLPLLILSTLVYAQQYQLIKTYTPANFFEEFNFFTVSPSTFPNIAIRTLTHNRARIPRADSSNMFHSTQQLPPVWLATTLKLCIWASIIWTNILLMVLDARACDLRAGWPLPRGCLL